MCDLLGAFLGAGGSFPSLWSLHPWERLNVVLHNPGSMETAQTELILLPVLQANRVYGNLWDLG